MTIQSQFSLPALLHPPPLDSSFQPAAVWNRSYAQLVRGTESPVSIHFGLEQGNGSLLRHATEVLPERHPQAFLNFRYTERLLKFLLWSRGGTRVYFDGPVELGEALKKHFSDTPTGRFDADFMTRV